MSGRTSARLADVQGTSTRYWQFGDNSADPIILVHGFRGDHHGLELLARELVRIRPEVRAIVPDLPGFGRTSTLTASHTLENFAGWLQAFARQVAPSGHTILGHSFGSLVVANAIDAGLAPDRAILINPISSPALAGPQAVLTRLAILYYLLGRALPERPARALLGNPLIVRLMSEVMAKTPDRTLRSWIHRQHHHHFSDFSDTTSLLEAFRASVSHTVRDFHAAFTMPTLLIAGEVDDITPLARQLDLHHEIPGSSLRILPHVGHLIHYESFAVAAHEINAFLDTPVGGAAR